MRYRVRTGPSAATFTQGIPGISQIASSSGTLYLERTPSGQLLSMQTGTGSTVPNYNYVPDGLGSIINLVPADTTSTTTAGATPVAAYTYTPYGTVTATTNPAGGTLTVANTNPFRYTGAYQDPNTTLIHLGARWYDPNTSRFTQQDGITHLTDLTQGNRYAYAADNPTNNTDPSGAFSIGDAFKGAAVVLSTAAAFVPGGPGLALGGAAALADIVGGGLNGDSFASIGAGAAVDLATGATGPLAEAAHVAYGPRVGLNLTSATLGDTYSIGTTYGG